MIPMAAAQMPVAIQRKFSYLTSPWCSSMSVLLGVSRLLPFGGWMQGRGAWMGAMDGLHCLYGFGTVWTGVGDWDSPGGEDGGGCGGCGCVSESVCEDLRGGGKELASGSGAAAGWFDGGADAAGRDAGWGAGAAGSSASEEDWSRHQAGWEAVWGGGLGAVCATL